MAEIFTFTERPVTPALPFNWSSVPISDDGLVVMPTVYFGNVFLTKNGGTTWASADPDETVLGYYWNGGGHYWEYSAVSGDGNVLVVTAQNDIEDQDGDPIQTVYMSTDCGVTWVGKSPTGDPTTNWHGVAIDNDGSHIILTTTTGVWLSTDSGATWSEVLKDAASIGADHVSLSADGATITCVDGVTVIVSDDTGSTWTEHALTTTATYCRSMMGDTTGQVIFCSAYAKRLHLSIDGGENWTEPRPDGDSDQQWYCGMSRNGQVLWAAYSTKAFISENQGSTWTEVTIGGAPPDYFWFDADGSKRYASFYPRGRIYEYVDSSWTEVNPAVNGFDSLWGTVVGTDDNQIQIGISWGNAGAFGRVFITTDYGVTWNETQPTGDLCQQWYSCAVSRNGLTFIVGDNSDHLYTSTDGGDTWTRRTPGGKNDGKWYEVAISDNGLIMYAASYDTDNKGLFKSINGGVDWANVNAVANKTCRRVSCSGDGQAVFCNLDTIGSYYSNNAGIDWTLLDSSIYDPPKLWCGPRVSQDGSTLMMVIYSTTLKKSTDAGQTWETIDWNSGLESGNWGIQQWTANSDYSVILLSIYDGYPIYDGYLIISTDGGVTWDSTLYNPGDLDGSIWRALAVNEDGTLITTGSSWGPLFTGERPGADTSDAGYYPAAYIHGLRIEDGESALKNQTQVDMDWKLPFAYPYIIAAPDDIVEYKRIRVQHTTPFWTQEKSLENSRPIELHKFSTATEIWRYADAPCDVDYNGTDGIVTFRGFVQNVNFKQDSRNGVRRAEVTIEPYSGNTRFQALAMTYERLCPVALYGTLCLVDEDESGAVWNDSGVLTGVTNTVLTATEFGDQADGWYDGGKIRIDGRVRKVLSHVGTSITISRIIYGSAVGDAFTIYAGCDRLPATCAWKFDNLPNCKALPNIPHEDSNPFGSNGVVL